MPRVSNRTEGAIRIFEEESFFTSAGEHSQPDTTATRRSNDEYDGGCKQDDGQRIMVCGREPLHFADRQSGSKTAGGPLPYSND